MSFSKVADQPAGTFLLPDLPYDSKSLEPYISEKTLSFHHGKHHAAYVSKLNAAIESNNLQEKSLEEIILATVNKADKAGIFNNAAQIWNHTFYWNSMKPSGGGLPYGDIADAINRDFGNYENFQSKFSDAAATQFGSGWAWLVLNNQKLEIKKTLNADLPITNGETPLLTIDVWEHAYYLDFQNKRPDYISTFLDKLVNWDFANQNLH